MELELPATISPDTVLRAGAAVEALRAMLAGGAPPAGVPTDALSALLTVMDGVTEAAALDNSDLSLSEAAERLGVARPSVMRLIARGELTSRKNGGHYVLSPRELRAFEARLASVRREALNDLGAMAEEFGF